MILTFVVQVDIDDSVAARIVQDEIISNLEDVFDDTLNSDISVSLHSMSGRDYRQAVVSEEIV